MSTPDAGAVMSSAPSQIDPLAALLDRVSRQDEPALAELYQRMNGKIFAFALRHVGDQDLAGGVVVETMFEVWKSAAKFGGASSVSTWILGIARHKALDEVRRRMRHAPLDEAAEAEIPDGGPSAFDGLAARERRTLLDACIARLPPDQRECIHLVFFQDLPLADIAAIQGVPENTVKTRLFHARRKLKLLLSRRMEYIEMV